MNEKAKDKYRDAETLKTAKRLRVPVLREDEDVIKAKARALGLSTSDYLRKLGLGFKPTSTLDFQAVTALAKVNGDQGRLGGLLKLWLTDDTKFRELTNPQDVRSAVLTLLLELGEMQKQLQGLMKRIAQGASRS